MLSATDIHKSYAAQPVLAGVTINVEKGEIFGFVGPNGAGKTTFLKCLLGLARIDSGSIRLGDVDAVKQPLAARRLCAYAPSETAMYDSMTVRAMLDFALAFHKNAELDRAHGMLDSFGLPHKRKVRALSHGMKRKLLLTQAICSGTPIILLDEPMEGLDPEARRELETILEEASAQGKTIFFSSHDLASVERVCNRVAFLRNGKLLECDTVASILERAGHTVKLALREPLDAQSLPKSSNLSWTGEGTDWQLNYHGKLEEVFDALYGPEKGSDRSGDADQSGKERGA
ncbi:MAG: ABC transporter ATP-binding protein [Planctomycetes bacterium]|nr:ABC transporter ATP-binding protein [Planctomycetota bacterium]MCP4769844.1 ABC transporter ATP-binding protein [Planctomycetota bacterium]MCP4859684.1 ABC transporter ATP-binding protein [Planctomycetota bacterium]